MAGMKEWLSSIVCYLIFTSAVMSLLPSGKYEKYLRLFAGCVLILLVLKPVTGGLGLEERLDALFRSVSFEYEIGEFSEHLGEIEQKRMDRLFDEYEAKANEELIRLAEREGLAVGSARVRLARDPGRAGFGTIERIEVRLLNRDMQPGEATADGAAQDGPSAYTRDGEKGEIRVAPVQTVTLEPAGAGKQGASGRENKTEGENAAVENGEGDGPFGQAAGAPAMRINDMEAVFRLRREIADYYQVEENYVEIRLEN